MKNRLGPSVRVEVENWLGVGYDVYEDAELLGQLFQLHRSTREELETLKKRKRTEGDSEWRAWAQNLAGLPELACDDNIRAEIERDIQRVGNELRALSQALNAARAEAADAYSLAEAHKHTCDMLRQQLDEARADAAVPLEQKSNLEPDTLRSIWEVTCFESTATTDEVALGLLAAFRQVERTLELTEEKLAVLYELRAIEKRARQVGLLVTV